MSRSFVVTGRAGQPAEVADVVAHLLSARFVNGAVVAVDGGRAALGIDPRPVTSAYDRPGAMR